MKLKEYHNNENYKLREAYELNSTLFPNWTSHAFLLLLMYVFPPIICEKIVLTLRKRLQIPVGNERISRTYKIVVTDEQLTQVIYTHGKCHYIKWGWCSCTLMCIDGDLKFNFPDKTVER